MKAITRAYEGRSPRLGIFDPAGVYQGARQIFEAIGLKPAASPNKNYFTATSSRIEGIGMEVLG